MKGMKNMSTSQVKNNQVNQDSSPYPHRWKALGILSLVQFLIILDTSIIGVALPTIQQHFSFSQADLQWIFNAYVIVFGALLLLGGRLSDIIGKKKDIHNWLFDTHYRFNDCRSNAFRNCSDNC
jgi:hypothetical protein